MKLLIVQERIPDYRVALFEGIRSRLGRAGHQVELVFSRRIGNVDKARSDAGVVGWSTPVRTWRLDVGRLHLDHMGVILKALRSDVVILEHAARHTHVYLLLLSRLMGFGPALIWWGHGDNLQARDGVQARLSALIKGRITAFGDGALAYTEESAKRFIAAGLDRGRVIVVNNSTDVSWANSVADAPSDSKRCAFLGSLYKEKWIDVLVAASDLIRQRVSDFELEVLGDGPERLSLESASTSRPWLHMHGRVVADEKAAVLSQCVLLLNPGLVGLVAVESLASGRPIVTFQHAMHSPEFEYLVDQRNAIVVAETAGVSGFAEAVASLLEDPEMLESMRRAARDDAQTVSLEGMIARYCRGVVELAATERELGVKSRRLKIGGIVSDLTSMVSRRYRASVVPHLLALLYCRRGGRQDLCRLGSIYGGWWVPRSVLRPGAVAYCAGVGEDASFDEELAEYGLSVWAFDPTPRAISFMASRNRGVNFLPVGWWDESDSVRFYAPADRSHVSYSIDNLQGTGDYFDAQVDAVDSIAEDLGHPTVDLVKMDIEGAERRVVPRLLARGPLPSVLCVEFDYPYKMRQLGRLIRQVRASGFELVKTEHRNFTFVLRPDRKA